MFYFLGPKGTFTFDIHKVKKKKTTSFLRIFHFDPLSFNLTPSPNKLA
jgi:hypothetical protein